MHRSTKSTWLLCLELFLGSVGITLLVWCGFVVFRASIYQLMESAALNRSRTGTSTTAITPTPRVREHLIGRLEVPRVNLSVMVVEGDDEKTLSMGAGHLPDTPLPWEFGNSAIAGHRDSFFVPLQHVKVNDRVRLTTRHGNFEYEVSRLSVVDPDDLSVLKPKATSSLTLVTCYPFSFVGHAPKRFIVQADHVPPQ